MASSSNDPDSLVTLRFHDFRVERMRHWWTLLGEDDHADIVGIFGKFPPFMRLQVDRGLLEALASFWDPTHCCFSIGEVDLIPTMEEYAELLQLDSPFSETPVIPIQGPRSNRCLEKYLGLTTAVLRPEIARPEETWRKANISLDLLTKYFSRSAFPAKLARDFIVGKKGWKKFRINAFKIAFAGIFLFPTSAGRIDLGVIPIETGRGGSDVLHTAPPALVLQSPAAFPPPPDSLSLLRGIRLPGGRHRGCPGLIVPSSMECLFLGCGVVQATIPALLFVSLAVFSTRLAWVTLDAVTFDYIPGEDMWRLLLRIEDIWGGRLSEMVLIEEGSPGDSSVTSDFVEWREGWTPFFTLRPTVRPGAPYSLISRSLRVSASTGQPERVTVLERELEEAQTELLSLRLARASEREASAARVESLRSTLHHNSVAVANLRRDLVAQRGNVSTLRTMNEFIREQLEISEDAKEQLEETLAEAREQLETEQAERTRVQDELDSLRSYTQALVDPATGRPQDIVALRRALDASEEALTSARTSMGVMRVQISVLQGDNGVLQAELDLELAPSGRSMMRGIRPFPLCHNPIFTPGIFSGVGTQNEAARTKSACSDEGSSHQVLPRRRSGTHFPREYQELRFRTLRVENGRETRELWPKLRKNGPTLSQILVSVVDKTAYLGGNVCAKILSDPLQLGPRAKTLRQEVHFSYHMQLSDRQELLRSSRNLSQKMTPWHEGTFRRPPFARSYLANPNSPLCKACTVKKQRKLSDGTKNVKIRHRELGQICARTGTRFEKKRAGSKTHFFSRTAAFARRVFPARNKLIREPGCVGKIMTPATTWNSRFADSIPRLTGICIGRVHKNSSDTPTSGSHNSLVRTPIRANFISLERGRRELSDDMPHDPF
uniref:DUF7745 domain-containing protein n=1 Tax=Fagus sylvatica TaxID=28930 RepID=A0A2N9GTP8_FAGSY